MATRLRGAPSKYDPAYADRVVAHMSRGLSFESFAGSIGVDRDTLYEWAKRHREFSDAKKRGRDAALLWWEQLGIAAATGSQVKDLKGNLVVDGRKVSAAIWIYNMKCRFREDWREDISVIGEADNNKNVFVLNYSKRKKEA